MAQPGHLNGRVGEEGRPEHFRRSSQDRATSVPKWLSKVLARLQGTGPQLGPALLV